MTGGPRERTAVDYGTEVPGSLATTWQLRLAVHRYAVVARYAVGKDVLDAACGAGQGLALLARCARSVVAGDITASNLADARLIERGSVRLVRFDAERLPFRDSSFDLIVMLEAIYYLADARRFLSEAWRLLRADGQVIVGSVNPRGRDFGGVLPHSTRLFDSRELHLLLGESGFAVEVYSAFPVSGRLGPRMVSALRGLSSRLGLPWPRSVRWFTRRMLHGPIRRHPRSLEGLPEASEPLVRVGRDEVDRLHQVLYAIGTKRPS